jgi:hypothetical protein
MRGTAVPGNGLHDKRELTGHSLIVCTGGLDPKLSYE